MRGTTADESGMEVLSGVDAAFLSLETAATPMHVGSLHLFDASSGYRGDFRAAMRRRMKRRMVPVLRRHLASLPLQLANPVWVQGAIDLDWHIRRVRLPAPGTWAQLEATVAALHAKRLDRTRPLWMLYVLEGLASGDQACYFKIHHAMLDGHAGVALAGALFDSSPDPEAARPTRPRARAERAAAPAPGLLALAAAAVRHDAAQYLKLLRGLPAALRTLSGIVRGSGGAAQEVPDLGELRRRISFAPRTPLNVTITPARGFATVSVARAELKAIAQANQATVNDVVLALVSGALRRYLKRNAALPRKSLVASMPISLRAAGNTEFRTQAALSLVSLASNVADPLRRLAAIRASAGATKAVARRARSIIPTDIPLLGVPWLLGTLATLYGRGGVVDTLPVPANVLVSNVPGPAAPLYADGLRMSGYWPLSIVEHGVGVNITLIDYADTLCLGFTVARRAVPDARELAEDFLAACEELKQCHRALPAARKPGPGRVRRAAPAS